MYMYICRLMASVGLCTRVVLDLMSGLEDNGLDCTLIIIIPDQNYMYMYIAHCTTNISMRAEQFE